MGYDWNFSGHYMSVCCYPGSVFVDDTGEIDDYLNMLDAGGPLDNKAAV